MAAVQDHSFRRCRAFGRGCIEEHASHTCKYCGDHDSDHKSVNCAQKPGNQRCKAQDCNEDHACHFCRVCGDQDADHRSANCAKRDAGSHCKATGCTEAHTHHVCRLCDKRDSRHKSQDCPERACVTLYHGTRDKPLGAGGDSVLQSIRKNGLRPSGNNRRLGPGVYLTSSKDAAIAVARHFHGKGDPYVLSVRVDLGKTVDLYHVPPKDARLKQWQQGADSAYAAHPPWNGINVTHLREFCVPEASRCSVFLAERV